MENKSEEFYKLLDLLNSEDRQKVASAEAVLGVCKYPENYWIMPDYYYPGIDYKISKSQLFKNLLDEAKDKKDLTSNDFVLEASGFLKDSRNSYSKLRRFDDLSNQLASFTIQESETILLKDNTGNSIIVPWNVFCGIFLKARELGYSRPDVLDNAGPIDEDNKNKWLANQEKIKELQSKID